MIFKYCPGCGAKLTSQDLGDDKDVPWCGHCAKPWFPVFPVAMIALVYDDEGNVPEHFWKGYYNIGSGSEFRLTNYRFEQLLMNSMGCPTPEKVFEPGWFATRNFHIYSP